MVVVDEVVGASEINFSINFDAVVVWRVPGLVDDFVDGTSVSVSTS